MRVNPIELTESDAPPHSIAAEQAVLGAILVDAPEVMPKLQSLKPWHFYDEQHETIYSSILALQNNEEPIDLSTVAVHLKERKKLAEVGGASYLVELLNSVATTASAAHHAKVVKERCEERKLLDATQNIVRKLYGGDTEQAKEILKSLDKKEDNNQARPLETVYRRLGAQAEFLASHRNRQWTGYPQKTIPGLDSSTRGLQALIAIAAGPGCGKTTLAAQLAIDSLSANPRLCALFVSLEMPESTLLTRLYSRILQVPYFDVLTKNTQEQIDEVNRTIYPIARRLAILDRETHPQIDAEQIIKEAARLKELAEADNVIIVIDYFQRFPIPDQLKKELRQDAQKDEYRCEEIYKIRNAVFPDPVIVICQANKNEGFKAAGMQSVKGSSDIVYDADTVCLVNTLDDYQLIETIRRDRYEGRLQFRLAKDHERKEARGLDKNERAAAVENLRADIETKKTDFVELVIPKVRGGMKKRIILEHRHELSDIKELNEHGPIHYNPFNHIEQTDFTPDLFFGVDGPAMQVEDCEIF